MNTIQVLDCTLRDGGYVNNWCFGEKTIEQIYLKLCQSSVEIIECGFVSDVKQATKDMSVYRSISEANKVFQHREGFTAVMMNCGEVDPHGIEPYSGGTINTVRVAFHKHQIDDAKQLVITLKDKGYKVFLQPMNTISYTDAELLSLIDFANASEPEAFYLVDSFGTMRKRDLLRMFYMVDHDLKETIKIGFHSHNNLQLSFSHAQELISLNSKRCIIIDTSVLGMGRGAGNLCTELLTQYINENLGNKYDLIPILEIMDEHILPIFSKHPWGYSAPYYIAAVNNCHPNYATYLANRVSLCVRDINSIIRSIPKEKKKLYDSNLINSLYHEYQVHNIDDSATLQELSRLCQGRKILILAPGSSLSAYRKEIEDYIARFNPVVFCVNHIPELFQYDRVFVSNLKRFKSFDDAVERLKTKLICTSNISCEPNICVVNYASYLNENDTISDNSGLMIINVLNKIGVRELALAGYDGFDPVGVSNYYDEKITNTANAEQQEQINNAMAEYFIKLGRKMNISFITPSLYTQRV